jgi:hypothetical protein
MNCHKKKKTEADIILSYHHCCFTRKSACWEDRHCWNDRNCQGETKMFSGGELEAWAATRLLIFGAVCFAAGIACWKFFGWLWAHIDFNWI